MQDKGTYDSGNYFVDSLESIYDQLSTLDERSRSIGLAEDFSEIVDEIEETYGEKLPRRLTADGVLQKFDDIFGTSGMQLGSMGKAQMIDVPRMRHRVASLHSWIIQYVGLDRPTLQASRNTQLPVGAHAIGMYVNNGTFTVTSIDNEGTIDHLNVVNSNGDIEQLIARLSQYPLPENELNRLRDELVSAEQSSSKENAAKQWFSELTQAVIAGTVSETVVPYIPLIGSMIWAFTSSLS